VTVLNLERGAGITTPSKTLVDLVLDDNDDEEADEGDGLLGDVDFGEDRVVLQVGVGGEEGSFGFVLLAFSTTTTTFAGDTTTFPKTSSVDSVMSFDLLESNSSCFLLLIDVSFFELDGGGVASGVGRC
jgi:hypothetical protein